MLYHYERTTIYVISISRWANDNNTFFHCIASKQMIPRGIAKSEPVRTLYCEDAWQQLCFLRHIARKAMTGVIFTRRIARSDDNKHIVYVILKKAMTQSHAKACLSSRRRVDIIFLMLQEAVVLPGSNKRQWFNHRETRGRNNQILYAVHQRMTAISAVDCMDNGNKLTLVCCIARTDDDKGWLQRGMQDCATQQPTIFFIASQGCERLAAIRLQEGRRWSYFLHHIATNE